MNTNLENKVVLITGGAKRVGAAICRELHAHGANLMIHYNTSKQAAKALQAVLNLQRPDSVSIIQGDLLNAAIATSLVKETTARFGKLDILINNASTYEPTEIGNINEENWHDLIGSNLKAPTFIAQAAAKALKKSHGCIVNITDMHIESPKKGYVVYSVNAVAPGPVLWPENNPQCDEVYRQRVISQTLLKRIGDPTDIAKAVKFLAADAPFITGHVLAVDGGRSINL